MTNNTIAKLTKLNDYGYIIFNNFIGMKKRAKRTEKRADTQVG
jgi:hypothetical protein